MIDMLFRKCAGGVVFFEDTVFLIKNDKEEWALPKGIIHDEMLSGEVALLRVKTECGIDAEIIGTAGETSYEFYSQTRKRPVCNDITWFVMVAKSNKHHVNTAEGFTDGGFFGIEQALKQVTYTQDRTLLKQAYGRLKKNAVKV